MKRIKKHIQRVAKREHLPHATLILLSSGIIIAALLLLWAVNLTIPDFGGFDERRVSESTKIFDRTGEVALFNIGRDITRTVLPSEEISRHIKNATVAIEDAEFYQHHGVKPTAIVRAFLANLSAGSTVQGGSTITQQVIKNALLTKEKKIARKIKEAVLAVKLEGIMEKDEILTLYLNESPYGGSVYGVEEAAQRFFGKKAIDVTLAEAAYLAALPKAPTFYSPYGNNVERLESRQDLVLRRMAELGFVSEEEAVEAINELVTFLPGDNSIIKAPHFVFHVKEYIEKKYGLDAVEIGGLKVITTLDWNLQKLAEETVSSFAQRNEENFNAKNAGFVGIDPKTGQILVMVGSRDYFERENDGNFNVTKARRQPGSAFKPFVYATAFKKGYTPDTVVFDVQTQFDTNCGPVGGFGIQAELDDDCYVPQNFDNTFKGPVTFREALAQSMNIPAIKALYLAGIPDALQTARDFGINSFTNQNRYGLTLVLGGGEVTLLELTNAYGAFANDGIYNPVASILRIEDADGNVLEEFTQNPSRAIDANVARMINDILSDNQARTPTFGANSPLYFPGKDVAVKTGTTNDSRDMWTIGYTPNFVLGAWVGNNDNSSMVRKVAGLIVAPMWRSLLEQAMDTFTPATFVAPTYTNQTSKTKPVFRGIWQGVNTYVIDTVSGNLATEYTPVETREERVETDVHSILHWVNKRDPHGPVPAIPALDGQYILWETPVRTWAFNHGYGEGTNTKPTETDVVHGPDKAPVVQIVSPNATQRFAPGERVIIAYAVTSSEYPVARAEFYLGNEFLGTQLYPLTTFSFVPDATQLTNTTQLLKVVVFDQFQNKSEVSVPLFVSI